MDGKGQRCLRALGWLLIRVRGENRVIWETAETEASVLMEDPAAGKLPVMLFGTERTFGAGEVFFRYFWITLRVLEHFPAAL